MRSPLRSAVITGCGAVSAFGLGVPALWKNLLVGRQGVYPIRSSDAAGWGPDLPGILAGDREARAPGARRHRLLKYALYAIDEALDAAQLDMEREDRTRVGMIVATTLGNMWIGEAYLRAPADQKADPSRARDLLHHPYYALATDLARKLDVRGPVISPSIACASGSQAVGQALELIRRGQADVFIAGGAEALCEFVVTGFNCLRATSEDVARPFDARRNGLLLGEGAAMLVIESAEHAQRRGARAQAEVAGTGLAGDAVHMTAPARDGAGAARAIRAALVDAKVEPGEIDFISAHGTGTVYNDAMEGAAIRAVFGAAAARIPVNSIKGAIGHTLGAAGAFEAILCTRVLAEGVIPPTANCEQVDPSCGLDIVCGEPRQCAARVVLSTSSAFAGNNAALVLKLWPPLPSGREKG